MKISRGQIIKMFILAVLVLAVVAFFGFAGHEYFTLEQLKGHREALRAFSARHILGATLVFMVAFASTALAVPGAIVLSLAGGLLFGTLGGALLIDVSATAGATVAFLISRYVAGEWFEGRYSRQSTFLREEVGRHGKYYLLFLRVVPIMPFFLVNYLAGLTGMRASTFAWTTAAGMLPGALIYANAGEHLAQIQRTDEILSWPIIGALALLGAASLAPVIWRRIRKRSAG